MNDEQSRFLDADDTKLRALTPPPGSRLGPDRGARCEWRRDQTTGELGRPVHEGCPGWWRDSPHDGGAGWRCACACHEDRYGWPGYDEFLAFGDDHQEHHDHSHHEPANVVELTNQWPR